MTMKKWKILSTVMMMWLICLVMSVPAFASSASQEEIVECTLPEQVISSSPDIGAEKSSKSKITTFSSKAYSGRYGNQLTGKAKTLYNELVKHYYTNKESKAFQSSVTVSFDATIKNSGGICSVVENQAYNNATNQLYDIYNASRDAFLEDYPEVFWLYNITLSTGGEAKKSSSSSTGYRVTLEVVVEPYEFYDGASKYIADYNKGVNRAVKQIKKDIGNSTNKVKIYKGIHDYICDKVEYDDAASESIQLTEYLYAHTSANAFLTNPVGPTGERLMVCEGYAEAFKVLCDAFGLRSSCVSVVGNASLLGNPTDADAHQWNYVKIYNKWYLVDTTWDDGINYEYYLKGSNSKGYSGLKLSEERETFNWFNVSTATFSHPTLSKTSYEDDTQGKESPGLSFVRATVSKEYGKGNASFSNKLNKKTDGKLTWISSNTAVATVTSSGKVTIKDVGTCKITVYAAPTSTYAIGSASYTLTVKKGTGKLEFQSTSGTKTLSSKSFSIPLKTQKTDGKLTWTSSNTKIAKVSATGKVTMLKSGKVIIRVKAAAGQKYKAAPEIHYTLTIRPAKVKLSTATNVRTKKITINWKKTDSTSYEVQYSTSNKFDKAVKTIKNLSASKTSYTTSSLLKNKTYYVRIRAYNKNIKKYGSWSTVKKVKIKK
jgi:hypothetical protein